MKKIQKTASIEEKELFKKYDNFCQLSAINTF
jgi:hypothetical protein